ncbi:DUF6790 family protein [Vibrio sagamiensis]|uniref:Uncharacterized protein n=1 Tax=Vibrio sagamiensis NBRC 104589 TaxID=1219064 RepID=A0A511QHL5_9VIBR|nr:DUF6790 family protein [Vibrio sagamiensis]PNQ53866.1 hypothetical protein C1141_18950 [Vibrio agarivorans]GEM76761.1 hypothetical protein VSA01S_28730 [Vibrio sagamiensis NBRC 104589]
MTFIIEWFRPIAIIAVYFIAENNNTNVHSFFHILGPWIVAIMGFSVAFEGLCLGKEAAGKIGYRSDRPYQVQSALCNLAIAIVAVFVFFSDWGSMADVTITLVMLVFFSLSALNHLLNALIQHNFKPVNLLRPLMTVVLLFLLVPPILSVLS